MQFVITEGLYSRCGLGSSVGIETGYGLDGPGIESRWGAKLHLSRPSLGPTQSPVQWVPGLSRGQRTAGTWRWTSPLLVPWSRKSRAIPLLPLWAVGTVQSLSTCIGAHFTFYIHFTLGTRFTTVSCTMIQYTTLVEPDRALPTCGAHCRNSSFLSLLSVLLALFRCARVSSFSILMQFF